LRIWEKFKRQNIAVPYPQRDVHVRSPDELSLPPRAAVAQ
jgi:small-conductance mechanosensitive channel